MNELEKDIERKLVAMVKRHGGLCLKWVCPGWVGVPDRIILLPGGCVMFVELKRPHGGRLSKMQVWWAKKLIELDFVHCVIWNETDLKMFERLIVEAKA